MVATSAAAQPDVLLLDTNLLVIYAREGDPSRLLEAQLGLQAGRSQGMISVVTVGEAIAFSLKSNWGHERRQILLDLIRSKLVPIDINRPEILEAYAEIDHYSEKVIKPARPLGQNDMWIAATARVLDCELVTTDRDFDHLHGTKLRRRWIDPNSLRAKRT